MDIEKLKQKILDLAIRGKLVPQDPNDEPASVLIEKIREEKAKLVKEGKIKASKEESYIYKGSDNCYYEKKGKNETYISNELPFAIPSNWSWIRLNNLGLFRKGPFGSSLTKDMFVPETTPNRKKVYEQKNAIQKDCTLGKYYITDEKFKSMQSFIAEPGDIIVSCAGTIGEIYILPIDAEIGIINQALMRVKLFDKSLEDYFIMYFDSVLKKEANDKGKGTGMKNIPPFDILKNMLIPIPPENELNRILNKLKLLIPKIERIGNDFADLNSLVEYSRQKLLDSIFGENSSYKSYYLNVSGKLENFASSITKGSTPTTYGYKYLDSGIPFIKVENVSNNKILKGSIHCFISAEAHEFQKRSQLKENDMLFSIAGTIGKICLITNEDIPANTNQAFAIISGYQANILPKYLLYYLEWSKSSRDNVDSHGAGMLNATLGGIKKMNIWFPKLKDDQQKIVDDIELRISLLESIL